MQSKTTKLRQRLCSVTGALLLAASAAGQPAPFVDLGAVTAPSSPQYAREVIDEPGILPDQEPPLVLTVRWVRFELTQGLDAHHFIDLDARNYTALPVTYALYDSAGGLIASDDTDGSFPAGASPGLSFGSTAERVPWAGPATRGQDGLLAAGTYWLAIVAGARSEITFGPAWAVTTPQSYPVGTDEGELSVEIGVYAGNTIPLPVPPNDACENALVIGENAGGGTIPVWTGVNLGATQDGASTCYPTSLDLLSTKDIWFSYVPSETGWATVTAGGGAGGAATPLLTRYLGGCGSPQVRCAGGGSFASQVGIRLTFAVTAGQPVLLGLAMRAGAWGDLSLSINLIGPPCDLETPVPSLPEIETACGDLANDGCVAGPSAFDLVQLGETVRGSLYNTRTTRDTDIYLLHLPLATTVRITAKAQLPFDVSVRAVGSAGCPGGVTASARSLSYLDLCEPVSFTFTGVGVYAVAITHNAQDEFDCAAGYGGYWLSAADAACEYAVFAMQPAPVQACAGATATFSAAATGATAVARGWEWELVLGSTALWRPVADGVFTDAGSTAVISGAGTDTLRIANVDAAGVVRFRSTARTCGTARSRPAQLLLRPADQCAFCPGDFNDDGVVTVQDIFDFLAAYFGGQSAADINGSGSVTVQDVFEFLVSYFAGCA